MWNLDGSAPRRIDATVLTRMPEAMRRPIHTAWAEANRPGHLVDSFLEGPCFDRQGNLYLTDIPHGRLLRVTPDLQWHCVHEGDGWPNGLALHADGSLWITDYRHGIRRFDPERIHKTIAVIVIQLENVAIGDIAAGFGHAAR